jgi:metal-responsive CopG/Arc/MetJ family transcriptional regulator
MNARKIATSMPAAQFEAVERLRRRLRLKRSQVVQEALSLWLSAHDSAERCEQYLRGYLRHPEDAAEAKAYAQAWARGLAPEDWK